MKIVINLLSLSGPDGWQTVSDIGTDGNPSLRAASPSQLQVPRDEGRSLFDDEGETGSLVSSKTDNDEPAVHDSGDALYRMDELVDEELRRAHDALLRRVPGGMDESAEFEQDEESAWRDDLDAVDLPPGFDDAQALRDAPARRGLAEPLCADCARRIGEAVRQDGEFAAGVHLMAPLRGTIGNLDGWCLEVDPDRVVLRDLASDLVLEFRRIGGQWVFDRAGIS